MLAMIAEWFSAKGLKLVIASTVILAAFVAGFKVDNWRMSARIEAMKAEDARQLAEAVQQARERERVLQDAKDQVEKDYGKRLVETARQFAAASADRDQLRNLIAQFNTYSVPADAPGASGVNAAGNELRLLARASNLAHEGVALVAEADRVAETATAAAVECRDRLTSLQEYVSAMRQSNGHIRSGN